MGFVVRNLSNENGRWKYRKVIPVKLRIHIDGNLTEFVRWLGTGDLSSPELMRKYADAAKQCESLIEIAKKRATGTYAQSHPKSLPTLLPANAATCFTMTKRNVLRTRPMKYLKLYAIS